MSIFDQMSEMLQGDKMYLYTESVEDVRRFIRSKERILAENFSLTSMGTISSVFQKPDLFAFQVHVALRGTVIAPEMKIRDVLDQFSDQHYQVSFISVDRKDAGVLSEGDFIFFKIFFYEFSAEAVLFTLNT